MPGELKTAFDPFEAEIVCVHMGCAIQEIPKYILDERGERPNRYVVYIDHGGGSQSYGAETIEEAKISIEAKMKSVSDRSAALMTMREMLFLDRMLAGHFQRFDETIKPALISYGPGKATRKPRSTTSLIYIKNAPFDENGDVEVVVGAMSEWGGLEGTLAATVNAKLGLAEVRNEEGDVVWRLSPALRELRR